MRASWIAFHMRKCGTLRNLVPFVQFEKCELHEYFSRFLNCANGTKSRNASQINNLIKNLITTCFEYFSLNLLKLKDYGLCS